MKIEIINDSMLRIIPEGKSEEIYMENMPRRDYEILRDRTEGYKIEPKIYIDVEDRERVARYKEMEDVNRKRREELIRELRGQ